MKLKSILEEILKLNEGRSEEIGLDKAVSIFKEASPSYSKANIEVVFRGKSGGGPFLYIDPSRFKRTSQNVGNYYTLWIDNRWPARFPKRSKSIVCSTSPASAAAYGTIYVVIPLNDASFGVVPTGDIWQGFKVINERYKTDLPKFFNNLLSHFFQHKTGYNDATISDGSYSALMEDLSVLESMTEEEWMEIANKEQEAPFKNEVGAKNLAEHVIKNNGEFINLLHNKILNWKENGFEVSKFSSLAHEGSVSNEVWTSEECLLIKRGKQFKEFKNKL